MVKNLASSLRLFLTTVVLCISLTACFLASSPQPELYYLYRVRPQDTLYNISWHFNVAESELRQLNQISRLEDVKAGQLLKVPRRGQVLLEKQPPVRMFVAPAPTPRIIKPVIGRISSPVIARNRGQLLWPISQGKLVSKFGPRGKSFHEGIDIRAASGTAIRAAHDGVVRYSSNGMRGYGNLIAVQGEGVMTVYAHNRRNHVKTGDKVYRGDKIAEVGMTGRATGSHLHFEVRIKDRSGGYRAVDPMVFLQSSLTVRK